MSPSPARALALALALWASPSHARGAGDGAPAAPRTCGLDAPGASALTAADCVRCHGDAQHGSHPVEVDYTSAFVHRRPTRTALRHPADVASDGVRLDGGRLTCLTCHDPRYANDLHLAIPGDLGQPPGIPSAAGRDATVRRAAALCRECHVVDEPRPAVAYR